MSFAYAINCMDGRVQLPVIDFIKKTFGVDFVDMDTDAGPLKFIAEDTDTQKIEAQKKRLKIITASHESRLIAIVGHHDCVGNPADKETQLGQIKKAVEVISSWGLGLPVVGLWVGEDWLVREVARRGFE